MDKQVQQGIAIVPGSLTAILEKPPGMRGRDRFLVIVDVRAEAGCALELVAAPQGINPLIKFVMISASAPQAPPGGALVRRTLRYEEAPPAADYREVWLGEGDAAISAKVALVM